MASCLPFPGSAAVPSTQAFMDQSICLEIGNTACGVCVCFVIHWLLAHLYQCCSQRPLHVLPVQSLSIWLCLPNTEFKGVCHHTDTGTPKGMCTHCGLHVEEVGGQLAWIVFFSTLCWTQFTRLPSKHIYLLNHLACFCFNASYSHFPYLSCFLLPNLGIFWITLLLLEESLS